jgi:hypothetical protein
MKWMLATSLCVLAVASVAAKDCDGVNGEIIECKRGKCKGESTSDVTCECDVGYTGDSCDEEYCGDDAEDGCDHGKCKGPKGRPDKWYCECDYPWEGDECDDKASMKAAVVVFVSDDAAHRTASCAAEFLVSADNIDIDFARDNQGITIIESACDHEAMDRAVAAADDGDSDSKSKKSKSSSKSGSKSGRYLRHSRQLGSSPSWDSSSSSWDDDETTALFVISMGKSNSRSANCVFAVDDLWENLDDYSSKKFYRVAGTHTCFVDTESDCDNLIDSCI